ncbi:MAG: hypothetical protein JNM56_15780 [Planctomycetia bacterium]|nr:hypothetical protein [Planctomycetia bacterium]
MKFDEQGHVLWTPKTLYAAAQSAPLQLVNRYLMMGTPWAFAEYVRYCDFLDAVAERTGVHPRNLYLRGSCQIGFSIAPKQTAWTAMQSDPARRLSDLDLVIVDEAYFTRFEREVRWWEDRNPPDFLQGRASDDYARRQQDRQFNCCRDESLPPAICIHHRDTMRRVAGMEHCGLPRTLSAFIYPDWLSARQRYEYDLRKLVEGIEAGRIPPPGDEPTWAGPAFAAAPAQSAPPVPGGRVGPAPANEP